MISENCVYAEKKKLIASLEYDEALLKSNTQELKALDHKKQLLEKQAELEMINASRKRAQQYEDALACKRQNAIDYQNQRARYNNTMQDDYFDQKRRQQLYHSEMQLQETIKDNTNNREIKLIMARAETTSNLIRSSHEHINLATLMVNRSNNNNLSSSTVQSGAYYNNIGNNFHQSTLIYYSKYKTKTVICQSITEAEKIAISTKILPTSKINKKTLFKIVTVTILAKKLKYKSNWTA